MNQQQIDHENQIIEEFVEDHQAKYEKGAIEHGGFLGDVPADQLTDFAIEEVLDQASYLYTLKPKVKALMKFHAKIKLALQTCSQEDLHSPLYMKLLDAVEELWTSSDYSYWTFSQLATRSPTEANNDKH